MSRPASWRTSPRSSRSNPPSRPADPTAPPPAASPACGSRTSASPTPSADRPALQNVSLEIGAGEIVALVGANGSGKTTLAKLLCRLYQPQAGRILWDRVDTAGVDPDQLRRQVAVIFQDFQHYALPARDNIGLGRHQRLDDLDAIYAAARHAGADAFLTSLPAGYDTILGPEFSGGNDLSIGQWQRIALARAFFRDAPFIILDEPTAALDARAEHDLFQAIRILCQGRSVLLISHRFSSVRTADRIYVLQHGRILEHGSHDQLMATGGLYTDLFTLQAAAYLDHDPAGQTQPAAPKP
jgi:ATP-binding cassette subfamily B protein